MIDSFVTQGFNRVEARRLARGQQSEKNSDEESKAETRGDTQRADDGREAAEF